jgi:hypothetical protein
MLFCELSPRRAMARPGSAVALFAFALSLCLAGANPLRAQYCEPCVHPTPPAPTDDPVWTSVRESTGSAGRIGVIVENDLYETGVGIPDTIDAYADVLNAEGYSVSVFKFAGSAEQLRDHLYELWDPRGAYADDPLTGALLVGAIPYVIFQASEGDDAPTDLFFMDLNGIWTKSGDNYANRLDDDGQAEIWVARVKVDNLVNLKAESSLTDADIINAFFARDLALREERAAYPNPLDTTLVYSMDCPVSPITDVLSRAFDLSAPANDWVCGADGSGIPGQHEHVRIDSAQVDMNMASTPWSPYEIWSLNFKGAGCGLIIPGETSTAGAKALQAHGSVIAEPTNPPASIEIGSRGKLDVDRGDLQNFSVSFADTTDSITALNVAELVQNCSVQAGQYVDVSIGPASASQFTLDGHNSFSAPVLANCGLTAGAGSTLTLGSILGSAGSAQDWSLAGASLTAEAAIMWGDWSFSGGNASFAILSANSEV